MQEGGRGKNRFVFTWIGVYDEQIFYLFFTYFSFLLCFFFVSLSCQQFSSRVQMTEDDLILHFFQFDGKFANLSSVCGLLGKGEG